MLPETLCSDSAKKCHPFGEFRKIVKAFLISGIFFSHFYVFTDLLLMLPHG